MSENPVPGYQAEAPDEDFFCAFEFSYPLYEMAKLRWRALHDDADPARTGLNVFWHQDRLATAEDRWVTTPNIDTLYSLAWLSLDRGPVQIRIPPAEGRYLNLALLDMYSNNFACLSQRDVGSLGAQLLVVGPRWQGDLPPDRAVIQAPADDVLVMTRTLVDDEADLAAARRVQQGFLIDGPTGSSQEPAPWRSPDPGGDFVSLVRDALRRNPPRAYEDRYDRLLRRVGLIGEQHDAFDARWSELVPAFLARIKASVRRVNQPVDGWVTSKPRVGDFGTSYSLRAITALGGLLALPAREAMYINTDLDASVTELHGGNVYRLDMPPDGVPAGAFWSLTLYEKTPLGQNFLAHNPLNRYAFTSRDNSLRSSADGLTVWISHRRPPAGLESNWLPAPDAPMRLTLRAYHPGPDLLAGRFRIKPVVRLDDYGQ
ncbi:MAG: DUF1254 domain-containing protein [Burkholderiaceae bacterium]